MDHPDASKDLSVKNLLFLHPLAHLGGGEVALYDLLTSLDGRRYRAHLVLPCEGPLSQKLRAKNISVSIIPFARGILGRYPPGLTPGAFVQIGRLAKSLPAHLIFINDSYLCLYGGMIARWLAIPSVMASHGWWDVHFIHQELLHRWLGYPILAVSEAVRQSLLQRGLIQAVQVRRMYLGVDTERFRPASKSEAKARLGCDPQEITLTIAARLIPRKGHDVFFEAAKIVMRDFPRLRLLVVGDKIFESFEENDATKRQILGLVERDPELKARTLFLGFRDDMPLVMNATDVLISSAWFETFGVAIAEAMSSCVPVVSTDVGGPNELVADGVTGFLVPPNKPDLVAAKTLEILKNPDLVRRFGEAARARVLEHFSLDRYVANMENFLKTLLS